jgi:ferredoxin
MAHNDLRISRRNSKVPFPNLSHTPVKGCGNCQYCAKSCYARKSYKQYPDVRNAWDSNLTLWQDDPEGYAADLGTFLGKTHAKAFRFFVAGDIPDQNYVDSIMIHAALSFPEIRFLVFTKMHHLDFSGRPGNLQVVFSQWPSMPTPARIDGIQWAWTQDGDETRIPANALWCPGDCGSCGMCWELSSLERDVYFDIH